MGCGTRLLLAGLAVAVAGGYFLTDVEVPNGAQYQQGSVVQLVDGASGQFNPINPSGYNGDGSNRFYVTFDHEATDPVCWITEEEGDAYRAVCTDVATKSGREPGNYPFGLGVQEVEPAWYFADDFMPGTEQDAERVGEEIGLGRRVTEVLRTWAANP